MAKVTNPLLSMDASGQFGHAMVFQKGGHVRIWVKPANPKTDGQMLTRNTLGDLQRTLKMLGTTLRVELKSGFGPRWNSMIIGELTANTAAILTGYTATFTAFTSPEKVAWAGVDQTSPVELTKGAVIYACAKAIKDMASRLGVTVSLTAPTNANAVTVGGEWTAST